METSAEGNLKRKPRSKVHDLLNDNVCSTRIGRMRWTNPSPTMSVRSRLHPRTLGTLLSPLTLLRRSPPHPSSSVSPEARGLHPNTALDLPGRYWGVGLWSVRKADWEPRFLREFEEYQRVDRIFRWQIWEEWTSGERRRAYMYTTNMRLKEEMRVWKRRVEARSRVSQGSAVRADTQAQTLDGGAESNPDL